MKGKGKIWPRGLQHAICNHRLRPTEPFFRRLKHQLGSPGQFVFMFIEQSGHGQADGRMCVMAAGMHDAGIG